MVAAAPGKQPFQVTFDHFSIQPLNSAPKEDGVPYGEGRSVGERRR